mgnify:FL=1|tara:strand:- start:2018 stop:3775 length:1758 start_codon:yes stop_codon:yes gene_type:complete
MKELRYLNKYLFKYKKRILLGLLITIIARIFALITPNLIGDSITILENFFITNSVNDDLVKTKLLQNILIIVGSAFLAGFFTFIMRQMLINVSRFIEFDLKNEIYSKYQELNSEFYKKNRTGDLMNRVSEDVSKVRMYIGPAIMYTINTVTLFIIVVTYMLIVAPKLAFYTLLPLPFLSLLIYFISVKINTKSKIVQEFLSKLTTYTQESFSGVKIIKAYTIEGSINKKLKFLASECKDKNMSLAKIQAWFFPLMILLIGISNIIVVYIGGIQYMKGIIELGILAEFIIYVNMLTWPVATVGWVSSIIQQAEASQKRINEFLKSDSIVKTSDGFKCKIHGKIEFKKVQFMYPETKILALNEISFRIDSNSSLAIMGEIGSGKSTILDLICGVNDPSKGDIYIDDRNLKKHNIDNLRSYIGFVPQNSFLFSDTIENNIRFGNENADLKEIKKVSKWTCILNDIEKFNKKFKTILGERGVNLSGGQKQRISISRALIKDPKILILDDSLSSVDTETEEQIIKNICSIKKNFTLIMTTNRISCAKNFDNILIVQNGKVTQFGNHNDLIKKDGYYKEIYRFQSSHKEII